MLSTFIREIAVAVYLVAFAALALRAYFRWRRVGDLAAGWFALAYGSLTLTVLLGSASQLAFGDDPPTLVSRITIFVLAAYPLALLHFAATFRGMSVLERRAVDVVTLLLVAFAALVPDIPKQGEAGTPAFVLFTIAFALTWALVSVRVASYFWFAGRRRVDIIRRRMRLLATGVALLTIALVAQAAAPDRSWQLAITSVTALSAVFTYLGFAPPEWFRSLLRLRDQQRLRGVISALVAARSDAEVRNALLPAARQVVGVQRMAFVHPSLDRPMAIGYRPDEVADIEALLASVDVPDEGTRTVEGRYLGRFHDATVVLDTPTGGEFFGPGEMGLLASIAGVAAIALSRVRGEHLVTNRERQLEAAIDVSELGSWSWELGAEHVTWSPRMHEIFGTDPDVPLTYDAYRALLDSDDSDNVNEQVRVAMQTGASYAIDHRIVRGDGEQRFVHSRGRVELDSSGEPSRVVGVTQDVTARVQTEQALREAVEVEREVAVRLRAVDELKSNILAAVSHELRTPLTSVHGFAIVLQDRIEQLSPAQRAEIVDHLVVESERLAQLLADLLDLDRLRRGAIDPNLVDTDIAQLVTDIVATREHSDRIELDLDPVVCAIDAPKVERIVENLVVNAEKHTPDGSHIWVRVRPHGRGVELRVEDDGPGIPVELRESIFEPFNRGDGELGHAPGTGIGLSLVSQFTRLHGGAAWVEERIGGGAVFVVTLPGAPATDEA